MRRPNFAEPPSRGAMAEAFLALYDAGGLRAAKVSSGPEL